MVFDGPPVVPSPFNDILLTDVKNSRKEGEEGVLTFAEIANDLGFEN